MRRLTQCEEAGLDVTAGRDHMLAGLARHRTAMQSERLTDRADAKPLLTQRTDGPAADSSEDEDVPLSKRRKPAGGGGASSSSQGRRPISAASLPSNLHSMSLKQLRSVWCVAGMACGGRGRRGIRPHDPSRTPVCPLPAHSAAHGFVPSGETTDAVIAELEQGLYAGTEAAPLLLE